MLLMALSLLACSGSTAPEPRDPGPVEEPVDADGDGYSAAVDCDDSDPAVHPGAVEVCNDRDDDCSARTLEARTLGVALTAPSGAEIVLCEGAHAGNLELVDRHLTIRGDPMATVRGLVPDRPVFLIDGGSLVLEDLIVAAPSSEDVAQASAELVDGMLVARRTQFVGGIGEVGRAVDAERSRVVLEDCELTHHTSDGSGGAVILANSTFESYGGSFAFNLADTDGGAIVATESTIRVVGTEFLDNVAQAGGGALQATTSDVTLSGVRMYGNYADFFAGAVSLDDASLTAIDSTFEQNSTSGDGGAVFGADAEIDLVAVELRANNATNGGAVYLEDSAATGRYVRVTGNVATTSGGGFALSDTSIDAQGWTIDGNVALSSGGGLYLRRSAWFEGDDSTLILGNSAGEGGGAAASLGSVRLTVGAIRGNDAGAGGGVLVGHSTALTLTATVEDNRADDTGGGLLVVGSTAVVSGAIVRNHAIAGGGVYLEPLGLAQSTLTGTIDWGAGLDDNAPDDVKTDLVSWSSDESGMWSCDALGCE